jgi:hypothetical protein
MTRELFISAICSALIAGLTACSTEPQERISAGFGEAVHRNMSAHIINPTPAQAAPTEMEGRRGHVAIERYMRGQVKEPPAPTTSTVGGGG